MVYRMVYTACTMSGLCFGYLLNGFGSCLRHSWDSSWDMIEGCLGHTRSHHPTLHYKPQENQFACFHLERLPVPTRLAKYKTNLVILVTFLHILPPNEMRTGRNLLKKTRRMSSRTLERRKRSCAQAEFAGDIEIVRNLQH